MSKPFTVYLIHHSHTDIGYTDYQEKIEMHHVFYIREVVDILNAAHATKPEWLGFKWNCESYWCVERFLAMADERYRADFIRYVKSGEIGLSGNYLNMTELVDAATLSETMAKSRREMERYGISMRSALTCDINGYSWGFADALYENGVTRLLSAIHTHHGYYPLGLRQTPFWWWERSLSSVPWCSTLWPMRKPCPGTTTTQSTPVAPLTQTGMVLSLARAAAPWCWRRRGTQKPAAQSSMENWPVGPTTTTPTM